MGRGGRINGERLVDGLTLDERLSLLETKVFGTKHLPGLERDVDRQALRLEVLESAERRRHMGWFARLMLRLGGR